MNGMVDGASSAVDSSDDETSGEHRHRTSSVAEEMTDLGEGVERGGCGSVEVLVASACQREGGTQGSCSPCLAVGSVLQT
jgi:hypothetical protein